MSKQKDKEPVSKSLTDEILAYAQDSKSKRESLDKDTIENLKKELFELTNLARHYSISRWNIVSFFMMLSFGITGYSLLNLSKPYSWAALSVAVIIYWFAIFLFKIHKYLTYAINEYIESLSEILGFYSPLYLKNKTFKKFIRSENVFYIIGIFYILFFVLILLP
jgi:hypothetical protein